jgi:hypothetical protein
MSEEDLLLEALRADLPTDRDRERVQTRLIAAGVLVTGVVPTATVAATSGSAVSSATGLLPKLAAMSWASKLALATVVSAGVATPAAMVVLSSQREKPALSAPAPTRASEPKTAAVASPPASEPQSPPLAAAPQVVALAAAPSASAVTTARVLAKRRSLAPVNPAPAPAQIREDVAVRSEQGQAESPVSAAAEVRSDEPVAAVAEAGQARAPDAVETREQAHEPSAPTEVSAPPPTAARVKFEVQLPVTRSKPVTPSQLAQETKLMEHALAALRARDVTKARTYLDEHALRFYDGLLRRDRERVLERIQKLTDGTTSRVK